jgi:translation initiation factor IF-2
MKANPNKPAKGTVLEAMLSEGEGVRATLLVREGTLHRGDVILCGHAYGRVRQMYNDHGVSIEEAGPSVPVRITGLDEIPNADDPLTVLPDLAVARTIAEVRKVKIHEAAQIKRAPLTLENVADAKIAELKLVLKADFKGSIEAIKKEMDKFSHEEVKLRLLHAAVGAITESDVNLALTSPQDTLIVGFNVIPDDRALALAEATGVKIREYDIIYNLTNDIKAALEGKLKPREEVVHLGRAVVRDTFKISRVGTIAGCFVTQGSIKRNAKVRIIREGAVIYPPPDRSVGLDSLKRFKEDVGEVQKDFECGMKVTGYDDIKVGDIIEAFRVDQVQRTLEMAGTKN